MARQSPKIFARPVQRGDQSVDLLGHGVEVERRARGRRRRRAPPSPAACSGGRRGRRRRRGRGSRPRRAGARPRARTTRRRRGGRHRAGPWTVTPGHLAQALQRVGGDAASRARGWRRGRSRSGSRSPRPCRRPRRWRACPPRTSRAARSSWCRRACTERIISPPVRNGGIASSSSRRPLEAAGARRAAQLVAGEREEVGSPWPARRPGGAGRTARRRPGSRRPARAPSRRARGSD